MEVKSRSDADQYTGLQAVTMRRHPALLLGCAETDPDDIRAGSIDLVDDGGILLFAQRAKGGAWLPAITDPGNLSTRFRRRRSIVSVVAP